MWKNASEWFEVVVLDYFVIHPSLWAILAGLALQAAGLFFGAGTVRLVVELVGFGAFLFGCCRYAEEKGWNEAWGWLAVFHLAGLVVLFCLKDRRAS